MTACSSYMSAQMMGKMIRNTNVSDSKKENFPIVCPVRWTVSRNLYAFLNEVKKLPLPQLWLTMFSWVSGVQQDLVASWCVEFLLWQKICLL